MRKERGKRRLQETMLNASLKRVRLFLPRLQLQVTKMESLSVLGGETYMIGTATWGLGAEGDSGTP